MTISFYMKLSYLLIMVFAVSLLLIPLYFPMDTWPDVIGYIKSFKKYGYLLENLVKKDITTKYRRSVLGLLWSVLNPLLMMLVISTVFLQLFQRVENFPLYYLTGFLIFHFVTESTSGAMSSILSAAQLIKKVYIPKYIFPLEKCLFSLVNMMFSLIAFVLMSAVLRFRLPLTIFLFPIPVLYAFVFSLGLGLILAASNVFFRDIGHLYGVWTTAWMYLTPIIYPEEILPEAMFRFIRLNPLYYYVKYFRQVTFYGTLPDLETNIICVSFSLIFLIAGLVIFKKNQDRFILYF